MIIIEEVLITGQSAAKVSWDLQPTAEEKVRCRGTSSIIYTRRKNPRKVVVVLQGRILLFREMHLFPEYTEARKDRVC